MAQWLYYTKKMLSTAVTHLADELEQTVLDFNDAVHNLSSSQATIDEIEINSNEDSSDSPINIVAVEPSVQQTSRDSKSSSCGNGVPQLQCEEKETCKDNHEFVRTGDSFHKEQHENIFIQTYHVTTTRQPETSGLLSTVTTTISKSSPSLTSLDVDTNSFLVKQSCHVNYANPVPFTSCKILSPHATAPVNHKNFEPRIPAQVCKSPVSEVIARDCSKPNPHVCVEKSEHCRLQNISLKRPGKVIRAQVTSVYEKSLHQSHRHFIPIIENPFNIDRGSNDNDEMAHEMGNTGQTTSVKVIVERASHPKNWLSFSTLSRALSFAFSHVVNLLLMAEDESQPHDGDVRPSSRHLSLTYHHHSMPVIDSYDFTSQDSYPVKHGSVLQKSSAIHPSLLRSTQSCESFEIIEQPTDQELEHCSEYIGHRPFLLRMFSQQSTSGEASEHHCPLDIQSGPLESCISSAEFCNFDFKTLVSDKCVTQPYSGSNIFQITTSVMAGGSDSAVTTSLTDFDCDSKEDEEDNESVSFTIISENDDDEDYISLQLSAI